MLALCLVIPNFCSSWLSSFCSSICFLLPSWLVTEMIQVPSAWHGGWQWLQRRWLCRCRMRTRSWCRHHHRRSRRSHRSPVPRQSLSQCCCPCEPFVSGCAVTLRAAHHHLEQARDVQCLARVQMNLPGRQGAPMHQQSQVLYRRSMLRLAQELRRVEALCLAQVLCHAQVMRRAQVLQRAQVLWCAQVLWRA